MVSIELRHNPFTNSSQAIFDGRLYQASSISKYLNAPFAVWANKIIECISLEANDDYSLTYVGFEPYAKILKHYSGKDSACLSFQMKPPSLRDSVKSRLNKLSLLHQSGLDIKRTVVDLVVYTDEESGFLQKVSLKLPKYSFCKINISTRNIKFFENGQTQTPCFVVSQEAPIKTNHQGTVYWFQIKNENRFCGVTDSCFWEQTNDENLLKLFEDYLEMGVLTPLLNNIVKSANVDKNAAVYNIFSTLDKTEPLILVDVPASLELGSTVKLQTTVLPAGSKSVEVTFNSLNREIVRVVGDSIEAVGTGETSVEAVCNGQLIGRFPVRAYKRIRARSIALRPNNLTMAVGECIRLQVECEPKNSDNISLSRIVVSDSRVISVNHSAADEISVTALKIGTSSAVLRLDNLECKCAINVFAKLEQLKPELSRSQFGIDEISRLTIRSIPENTLVGDYKIEVSPNTVARYDIGVGALIGMNRGKGKVVVTDERTRMSQSVDFNVV